MGSPSRRVASSQREHGAAPHAPVLSSGTVAGVDAEAVLQAIEQARVHLADARLGEVHQLADLAHRELLPVLEVDDAVLLHAQLLGDEAQDLLARQPLAGRIAVRVLEDVEPGNGVLAGLLARHRTYRSTRQSDAEDLAVVLEGHPHVARDFLVGGLAVPLGAQALADALVLLDPGAPRTREPVEVAQLVQQGTLDAQLAVRLEAHAARGIEGLDRRDESEVRGRVEVSTLDAARQAVGEASHDFADERLVGLDEQVARRVARIAAVAGPQAVDGGVALAAPRLPPLHRAASWLRPPVATRPGHSSCR